MSDSAALWTVAHQAPLSVGFSRQEYWSRLPSPSPGDLPDPGLELASFVSPALAGGFLHRQKPLFQIRSYSEVLGTHEFVDGGTPLNPLQLVMYK